MQITAAIPQSVRSVLSRGNQCYLITTSRLSGAVHIYFVDFKHSSFHVWIKIIFFDTVYLSLWPYFVQQCWHFSTSKSELRWWCISGFKTTGLSYSTELYCKHSSFNFLLFNFLRNNIWLHDLQRYQ